MPLRIISDNAADRSAVPVISSTAAGTAAANVLTDVKSEVHRTVNGTKTATYKFSWTVAETIRGVHIPWCNLSPTATIRVQMYSTTNWLTQVFDSNTILACPAPAAKIRGWAAAAVASAYNLGGGAHARVWMPTATMNTIKSMTVTITDNSNLQGYLECARFVMGDYWTPSDGSDYGCSMTPASLSKQDRMGDGSLVPVVKPKYRKQRVSFSALPEADRSSLMDILTANDMDTPMIWSMYADDANVRKENDHQMYCYLSTKTPVGLPSFARLSYTFDVESV